MWRSIYSLLLLQLLLALSSSALRLELGHAMLPHPSKKSYGGEDAFFVLPSAFGVADGVGGWARIGVNPAFFSRGIMNAASNAMKGDKEMTPRAAVTVGYEAVRASGILGSCTALLGTLRDDQLSIFNIGDSQAMVLRRSEAGAPLTKYNITKSQQHRFNFPYQLGSKGNGDTIEFGSEVNITVQEGDLVVIGTDGLWDNLFINEIEKEARAKAINVPELALRIANRAQARGLMTTGSLVSPFGVKAVQETGYIMRGGKLDDITVIVGEVKRDDTSPT